MDVDSLRRYMLAKTGASESTPFGPEALVYKVCGRMYALLAWEGELPYVSLKCEPERVDELRHVFKAVRPAPYFDKRHWNQVMLDGSVPEPELLAMVDDSYDLVVAGLTRAQRATLGS